MTSSSHRRRTRPKPDRDFEWRPVRGPLLAVAAVAAVALVVTLVLAVRPRVAAGAPRPGGPDRAAGGAPAEARSSAGRVILKKEAGG
ncbi:hypothetical protein ACFRFE_26565, partial [Streptomyces sp. NPDC056683]